MYLLKYRWTSSPATPGEPPGADRRAAFAARPAQARPALRRGLPSRQARPKQPRARLRDAEPAHARFIDPLPIMPVKRPLPNGVGRPDARTRPSRRTTPAAKAARGRTRRSPLPVQVSLAAARGIRNAPAPALVYMSPDLPTQPLWGFDGMVSGPDLLRAATASRSWCATATSCRADNGGFGIRRSRPTCTTATRRRRATASPATTSSAGSSTTTTTRTCSPASARTHRAERRPQRVDQHALVPRPPHRLHRAERLQGAGGLLHPLQRARHRRRDHRLPPARRARSGRLYAR